MTTVSLSSTRIALACLVLGASVCFASPQGGPKRRIAVKDIDLQVAADSTHPIWDKDNPDAQSAPPMPADLSQGVSEMLITQLQATRRFFVIDETTQGMADRDREKAISGGKAGTGVTGTMPAQLILTGAITDFKWDHNSLSESLLDNYQRHEEGLGALVRLDIKLTDPTTGEIWRSASAVGRAQGRYAAYNAGNLFHSTSFRNCALGRAVQEAVQDAISQILGEEAYMPWEGKVADVVTNEGRGTEIYLSGGTSEGIQVGDEFDIVRVNGAQRTRVGRCRVTSADTDSAVATPIEGQGFQTSDVVTYVKVAKTSAKQGKATRKKRGK